MESICKHSRSEFLARRDGVDYVRCLDCSQIYEAEDLESVPVYDDEEDAGGGKHAVAAKSRNGAKPAKR